MKYPTEYKVVDGADWKDNLQKKYYYTNNGVIYKISTYNDGSCSDEDIYTYNEISEFEGIKFDFKYTKTDSDDVTTYILLDYLIQVGDIINDDEKQVVIHDHDIADNKDKTLLNRFINLQKKEFVNKLINGNTITSIVNTLPIYFKVDKDGKYDVDCGTYLDYQIETPSDFYLGLFKYNEDGSIEATDDVAEELESKAEEECFKLATNIMSAGGKKVESVKVTTK